MLHSTFFQFNLDLDSEQTKHASPERVNAHFDYNCNLYIFFCILYLYLDLFNMLLQLTVVLAYVLVICNMYLNIHILLNC